MSGGQPPVPTIPSDKRRIGVQESLLDRPDVPTVGGKPTGDAFWTPPHVVAACWEAVFGYCAQDVGAVFEEPSVGGGAWAAWAWNNGFEHVIGVDIHPGVPAATRHGCCTEFYAADYATYSHPEGRMPDIVGGNIPFSDVLTPRGQKYEAHPLEESHLAKMIARARILAFSILPLSFLDTEHRARWLQRNPPGFIRPLPKRIWPTVGPTALFGWPAGGADPRFTDTRPIFY